MVPSVRFRSSSDIFEGYFKFRLSIDVIRLKGSWSFWVCSKFVPYLTEVIFSPTEWSRGFCFEVGSKLFGPNSSNTFTFGLPILSSLQCGTMCTSHIFYLIIYHSYNSKTNLYRDLLQFNARKKVAVKLFHDFYFLEHIFSALK